MEKLRFAMCGCGYVSHKHLEAIKRVDGELIAVLSKDKIVGHLDSHFPDTKFFLDGNEFQKYCIKNKVNWLSVISPNEFHFEQAKFGLLNGMDVICEKPLVVNPNHLDELIRIEKQTNNRVYSVLQLRLHEEVIKLKEAIDTSDSHYEITLRYVTPRGDWFSKSWKQQEQNGGLLYVIGIHLFDIAAVLFGKYSKYEIYSIVKEKAHGKLWFNNAEMEWFLSVDRKDIIRGSPKRYLQVGSDYTLNLDKGFENLHSVIYQNAINGVGYGIEDNREAIELIYNMKKGL